MSQLDPAVAFVRLALSINHHFPGYVDAYYGPDSIPHSILSEGEASLTQLEGLAHHLAQAIAHDAYLQADRRDYLSGEVAAMQTTLRILQGQRPSIIEEVRSLYGVTPAWVDETSFTEAQREVASLLPGSDPLAQRVHAFREKMRISAQAAEPILLRLGTDLRDRVRARFPLPPSEGCEFMFVHDKPWNAYNWYLGAGTSRIEFNKDWPLYIHGLAYLVAHEAYPGHHTEHAIKEELLYRAEGRLEHAILLNNTPSALISEGIATNALEVIAESEEIVQIYRDLLKAAGLPVDEARRIHELVLAMRLLAKVQDNQLLLLHGENASDEEVIAYGVRHALVEEDRERQYMQFHKDPLWRSYGFNYTIGYDIVQGYLSRSADRLEAFGRLLREPMTPALIASYPTQ